MSKGILFQKRGKILTCIFIALIVFLWLIIPGINFAQSPSAEETEKMKSIQIINPHPPFSLRIWLDNQRGATYAPGEKIKISFQTSQDSYVKLYNYDAEGRVEIVFPNQYSPHNFVRAGEIKSIEGIIDLNSRPGIEYVQGFATTRPITFSEKEENLISKEFMPEVSSDYKKHTQTIKGIIVSMPPTAWVSSNLLSYTVRPITPPPPPTNYGRIIVTSQPQGAKVYLDNAQRGMTPLNLDRVATGQHQIKLVMAGYQDWSNYVSVSPSRTTTVSADLIPLPVTPPPANYGRIIATSQPQGAKVYLDNVQRGTTPLNLDRVATGQHQIKLVMAGYQDWSSYVSVSPSRTTTVSADLVPLPVYGSISVYCNQGDARISLDGSYQKRTSANKSVEIKNVKQGYHELLITKDGYQDWISTIMVTTNQTYMVSAYLVPEINYGSIAVYCNVNGAKIFVNGTYKVATSSSQPKILEELKEREYEITLIMDGYRTWLEDIWVYAGETISIYVEMTKIEF